jgi:S1-C subfamily serine protease
LTTLLDDHSRLTFKKTREDSSYVPAFKVTLGIIPDYFFEGPGIRIDGISPGKTAEKAGLKAGDVILKLGNYDVKDMQAYMEGLSKFNKGDKTNVTIKRGSETMSVPVEFK